MQDKKSPCNGILVLNSGSSSIKFSLYQTEPLSLIYSGIIKEIYTEPEFLAKDSMGSNIAHAKLKISDHAQAIEILFSWLSENTEHIHFDAIGHRVVHGGNEYVQPTIIDEQVLKDLEKLIPLAPLHQGHNLNAIQYIKASNPECIQVACFDTAFHITQQWQSKDVALPRKLRHEGIQRYGFHGLSYQYIASVLPSKIGKMAEKKILIAHLGNGASICAMEKRQSVATTMGFTALEGLMMGTRTGSIDPGILLYLLQSKNYAVNELSQLLYEQSGLLGVSELSNDMRTLTNSTLPSAQEAIDLFCYRGAQELASQMAALRGCDAIIFTAGIGENSPIVREKILGWLEWLGIHVDSELNKKNSEIITTKASKIPVYVFSTNEEYLIASQTRDQVRG